MRMSIKNSKYLIITSTLSKLYFEPKNISKDVVFTGIREPRRKYKTKDITSIVRTITEVAGDITMSSMKHQLILQPDYALKRV